MPGRTVERSCNYDVQFKKGAMQKNAIFGEHYVYYNEQNNQQVICVEKVYNDRASLNKEAEDVKKHMFTKNDYFLNVLEFSIEVQKDWCATFYILKIFFDFPEKSLKQLIVEKKQGGTPVPLNEND